MPFVFPHHLKMEDTNEYFHAVAEGDASNDDEEDEGLGDGERSLLLQLLKADEQQEQKHHHRKDEMVGSHARK